ncbi:hypothetical protein LAZ67_12002072 [Cordylochernes scorpioides]|uniref:Uncharacterized protein n=1 Tax=Cordylochernes scorpioides TaxID=51811 RepID=A0ABY6L1J2_9ARAC|nr:hypothetical protein LAZ67_12002072 [Cordylochernes scorpioides]
MPEQPSYLGYQEYKNPEIAQGLLPATLRQLTGLGEGECELVLMEEVSVEGREEDGHHEVLEVAECGGTQNELVEKLEKSGVLQWTLEFKLGCISLEDDPRERWPKTVTTPETIKKGHNIVCEIAEAVGISEEKMRNIFHEELGTRKLCAMWVAHLLNAYQKQMPK